MIISSRTPEGVPHLCPICGQESAVEPSYTGGDACCPICGGLLWQFRDRVSRMADIPPEQIALDSLLAEIGADSLDIVELVMEMEEEFDVTIADDGAPEMSTVADFLRWIEQRPGVKPS